MLSFLVLLLPLLRQARCQYFAPIVPSNQFYGPQPAFQPPVYGQLRPAAYALDAAPIRPLNADLLEPAAGLGSDYAAYRRNAEMLQAGRRSRAGPPPDVQVVYGRPTEEGAPPAQSVGAVQTQPKSVQSLPKFLQGVDQDIVDQYKTIIRRPNSKYDEQVKELDELVSRLDSERQMLYRQFMQENDEIEEGHRQKVHQYVGQMSDGAQAQFAKISALLRNQDLPNEERWSRVLAIYGKMEPELKNEFESKFKDFSQTR